MRPLSIVYTAVLGIAGALVVISSVSPAFAGADSAYFSEPMLEQQLRQQNAAKPGGEWNNAKVNLPSYIGTATNGALGTPDPALDAVTAGQGVLPGGNVPGLGAVGIATQAALAAQTTAAGSATGAGAASGGGFSAVSATSAATGAALGILKSIP
jgi:hypothetical protein